MVALAGSQSGDAFAVLVLPIQGDIVVRINAVLAQQVTAARLFRRGALAGSDDGLSLRVLKG